ncbi:MAG: TIGR02584 family CRISPR-associated protein [Ignavibacteriae bacterium]|nr:TIGR02584 family CRISPR-associated protein [Ignavibacteriota bacterium]NOH00237.1 TIGR02584 family CRISPR-associated protein [Ignavibacteriota bacterium]
MKNILVCVSGLTPQIVTESLYSLSVQRKIKIDEIYILTTLRGKKVIEGKDPAEFTPKIPLKTEIENLCNKYKIDKPAFTQNNKHIIVTKEESVELFDVRTDEENILFPNKTAEFIKRKTSDPENVLYCVISGGRKTMSVHLANALSMFGRENDKLLHVLTSEENEFKGFYPVTLEEDKALQLSEIPFVRLRSIITSSLTKKEYLSKTYSQFVEYTQNKLKLISDNRKILINTITREISFDNRTIKLEPLQFALYYKLVERNTEKNPACSIQEITSPQFGKSIKEILEEYIPAYHLMENMLNPWWVKGFDAESFRSKRSKINSKLKELFEDENYYTEYKISSNKIYGSTNYMISASNNKFSIIYEQNNPPQGTKAKEKIKNN